MPETYSGYGDSLKAPQRYPATPTYSAMGSGGIGPSAIPPMPYAGTGGSGAVPVMPTQYGSTPSARNTPTAGSTTPFPMPAMPNPNSSMQGPEADNTPYSGPTSAPPSESFAKEDPGQLTPVNGNPPGVPPVNDPKKVLSKWQELGWVDEDGYVTTPWGQKMTLEEALRKWYPDRPPNGDEVPRWVMSDVGRTVPFQYWNQIPAATRNYFQNLYLRAGQGSGSRVPLAPVFNMANQAQYY